MAGAPLSLYERMTILQATLEGAGDQILWTDEAGGIIYGNASAARIVGYSRDELAGLTVHHLFPSFPPDAWSAFLENLRREGSMVIEGTEQRRDGTSIPVEISTSYLRLENREFVSAFIRDITERKTYEEKLRQKERELQAIVDTSPECIKLLDRDGSLLMMNRAGLDMIEAENLEQVRGGCVYGMVTEEYRQPFTDLTESVFRGESGVLEFEAVGLNGTHVCLETHAVPFRNERNEIVALLGITRDITERKRYENDLMQARDAAEAASRAKSEFLTNMSHEIRTPMTAIIGVSDLLETTELTPQQKELVDILVSSGTTLLALIEDVLDLARIEAGKVEVEESLFDLGEMIDEVVGSQLYLIRKKGLTFGTDVSPCLPNRVVADRLRLKQVLLNLVGNAVKFTDHGGIRVTASPVEAGNGSLLRLEVADTGIGIPSELVERIFHPFEQGDASVTRRYGGAGLGLAICRRLTALMKGTIAVESEPGKGSVFRVAIPLRGPGVAEPEPPPREAVPAAVGSLSILVAEDSDVNRIYLTEALRVMGHQVDEAADGKCAVELWRGKNYDCVLMDLRMPVMEGGEAVRIIREEERQTGRERTRIVAVTANAVKDSRPDLLAAGFDEVATKPVSMRTLATLLGKRQ